MVNSTWVQFLISQVWQLPQLLVYSLGIILAVVFWSRHPTVSLLCLLAFGAFLASQMIGSGAQFMLFYSADRNMSPEQIGTMMSIVSLVRITIGSTAWALLLIAMFGWRSGRDKKAAS